MKLVYQIFNRFKELSMETKLAALDFWVENVSKSPLNFSEGVLDAMDLNVFMAAVKKLGDGIPPELAKSIVRKTISSLDDEGCSDKVADVLLDLVSSRFSSLTTLALKLALSASIQSAKGDRVFTWFSKELLLRLPNARLQLECLADLIEQTSPSSDVVMKFTSNHVNSKKFVKSCLECSEDLDFGYLRLFRAIFFV